MQIYVNIINQKLKFVLLNYEMQLTAKSYANEYQWQDS